METQENIQPKNKTEIFFQKNSNRYADFTIDGHLMFLPKSELIENNESWYQQSVQSAIDLNLSIFQTPLRPINILFLESTDDWNGANDKVGKKKGDRLKGCSNKDGIMVFTPKAFKSETDFGLGTVDKPATEECKIVIAHELVHTHFYQKYGEKSGNIPRWINEGFANIVPKNLDRDFSDQFRKKLKIYLENFKTDPPSDFQIDNDFIPNIGSDEKKQIVAYSYGVQFLNFLLNQEVIKNKDQIVRKRMIVDYVDKCIDKGSKERDEIFLETFKISPLEVYQEFRKKLYAETP